MKRRRRKVSSCQQWLSRRVVLNTWAYSRWSNSVPAGAIIAH